MTLALQWNGHLLRGRDVPVHGRRPLPALPSLQLGLEGGVGVSVGRVVGEGLRALLAWVVVEELDDEGLLAEVLRGALLRHFRSGGLNLCRTL